MRTSFSLRTILAIILVTSPLLAQGGKPVAFLNASEGSYHEGTTVLYAVLKPAGIAVVRFSKWLPIGEYEDYSAIVFAGSVPSPPPYDERMDTREYYEMYLKSIKGEALTPPSQPADALAGERSPDKADLLVGEDAAAGDDPFAGPKPKISTSWAEDLGCEAVLEYVESGGVIVLLQGTVSSLARNRVGAIREVVGFKRHNPRPLAGATRVKALDRGSPVTAHLGDRLYDWQAATAQSVGHLAGAKVLAELVDAEGNSLGPFATVNTIGKGRVYWFGASPLKLLQARAQKDPPIIDETILAYFEMIAQAVLQSQPALTAIRREKWGITPLGAPGRLDYSQADSWPVPEVPPLPSFDALVARLAARKLEPAVLLAEEGEPRAAIVLPDKTTDAEARLATVLASHLNRMIAKPDPKFRVEELWAAKSAETKRKLAAKAATDLLGLAEIEGAADDEDAAEAIPGMATKDEREDRGAKEQRHEFAVVRLRELGELRASSQGIVPGSKERENRNLILLGQFEVLKALGVDLEALGPEGIVLKTVGNTVVIAGKDAFGLRHAVYAFLEALGCRYLWPGELGKVVPQRETLYAPKLDVSESPQMCMRNLRVMGPSHERCKLGLVRIGVGTKHYREMYAAGRATLQPDHGWHGWHRLGTRELICRGASYDDYWTRFGKEHPDWFALQPTGIRDQTISTSRPRLCHSNRRLIQQVVEEKVAALAATPSQPGIPIAPCDGGKTSFCMCAACRKLDPPNAASRSFTDCSLGLKWQFTARSLTDRVLWMSNRIAEGMAERFPDKYLAYDAYSAYRRAPVAVRPRPNLLIAYVFGSGYYLSDASREATFRDLARWASHGNALFCRSNVLLSNWSTVVPQNFARKLFYDFRFCHEKRMLGSDFDSILNHWSTMGLVYYVLAKAHWNPSGLSVEELVADYCLSGFGEAAEPMFTYFAEVEAASQEAAADRTPLIACYTKPRLARLRELLEKARTVAKSLPDPYIAARVRFVEVGMKLAELTAAVHRGGGRKERDALRAHAIQALEQYPLAIGTPYFGLMNYRWYR